MKYNIIISQFFKLYECKFAAIGAIIGGVLAQEVLRAISGKEKPMLNLYVFDGTSDALYDV